MARLLYGGTGADILLSDADSDDIPEFATGTYTAWTTKTGSTQITDLLDFTGAATTTVTSLTTTGSEGRIIFSGPDGYTAGIWLRDEAHTSYTRWLVAPIEDMATRAGTTDHGALTGLTPDDDHQQYFNTTRGDARYYTKTQEDAQQVRLTGAQTVAGVKTFSSAPVVPDSSFTIAKTTSLQTTLDSKLSGSSNVQALANVSDVAPADDNVLRYDTGTNLYVPTDLNTQYAQVDAAGRIIASANPQWYVPIVVVNEGDSPPIGFPVGGIVYSRPAAASIIPTAIGNNGSITSAACAVTLTDSVAVGDYIVFAVGTSGEGTLPSTFTVAYTTGAAAVSNAIEAHTTGSTQTNLLYARCTVAIPTGAVVTVTASANRAQFMVSLAKVTNLAVTSALDQSVGAQWGASTPLALTVGPSGPTTVANELAVSAFTFNPGNPVIRTISGTSGWTAVGPTRISPTTATRAVAMFFKVLASTQAVTANAQITNPTDGTNSAGSGVLITLKAA